MAGRVYSPRLFFYKIEVNNSMNLINDPWIPVRCQSGAVRMIRPLDLADAADPPMELAALRPDFNGTLAQFLVGLLQLIAPSRTGALQAMQADPANYPLQSLSALTPHFNFDEGNVRVMQDMDFDSAEPLDLTALLLEAPGENTAKNNADLFIKRSDALQLSLPLAAQALITLQMNAPSGGQGHRTSLRGGGPITMLLWPQTLKGQPTTLLQKLLLNVFEHSDEEDAPRLGSVLPWTSPCLTSEGAKDVLSSLAKQKPTSDERRLLCYFATPRRIRLQNAKVDECAWTGISEPVIAAYETKNFGANYLSQDFRHPLSPYYEMKSQVLPLHLNELGFTYSNWVQTFSTKDGLSKAPAIADVARLGGLRRELSNDAIWAFGFLMDNMKCVAWFEARYPVLDIAEHRKASVLNLAQQFVDATDAARQQLNRALRKAWSDEGKKGDTLVAQRELYALTENSFYEHVKAFAAPADEEQSSARNIELRNAWSLILRKAALKLFEKHAESGQVASESMQTLERCANAHKNLRIGLFIEVTKALQLDIKVRSKKLDKKQSKSHAEAA
jgi:CRISPR system Cascade subunit CasA